LVFLSSTINGYEGAARQERVPGDGGMRAERRVRHGGMRAGPGRVCADTPHPRTGTGRSLSLKLIDQLRQTSASSSKPPNAAAASAAAAAAAP
jgi:hypothetical protein